MKIDENELERSILTTGTEILGEVTNAAKRSVLDPQLYTEKFMAWAMKKEELKVSLFRFVDVLPNLADSAAVIRHIQEYFTPIKDGLPDILKAGMNISPNSIPAKLAAAAVRKQVGTVASSFILGETPQSALKPLKKLRKQGQAFTVDLLGEATVSESEARIYLKRYLELIEILAKEVPIWSESKPLIPGHRGESTPVNVSVKLSALYSQCRPLNADAVEKAFVERLALVLSAAKNVGAFVYVDMEDCSLTTPTLRAFTALLSSEEFRNYDRCGIVLQAYLRRTQGDLDDLIAWVQTRGTSIAVRLVKGAYWDTEKIIAEQNHWELPVWGQKESSDANYEHLSRTLLNNHQLIMPAFASHNVRSLLHAIKVAEILGVMTTDFEIQTLYGMGEPIAKAFTERGYLVRNYAPVGELIPGMGYLVRRLLENTSNEGFLRQSFHEKRSPEKLLRKPEISRSDVGNAHLQKNIRKEFFNYPLSDFTLKDQREKLGAEIKKLRAATSKAPLTVHPVHRGKNSQGPTSMRSSAPEDPALILAQVSLASRSQASTAIEDLNRYFPTWRATSIDERAALLFRTAEILAERKTALTANIVLESGKPWADADAELAEAVDFLNYYAHEAKNLFTPKRMGQLPGEVNKYYYEPRGVAVVISPWNFPLAIPCGMFAAALVCGNTCVLKPAEQTSLTAHALFQAFLDAGMPKDAASFLPGIGEEIGPTLTRHPTVATVVFTGSKEVGLMLLEQGAESSRGAVHVKRVISEMGGKNAIIVDEDADYDEAIKGILLSAFGYAGQKCSACSRIIAVGSSYDRIRGRLVEAVESLSYGAPCDPSVFLGPVIDRDAFQRIQKIIQNGKACCKLLVEGNRLTPVSSEQGYFIPPTIFTDVPPDHPLLQTEVFGPVVVLQKASNFSMAVDLANDSIYGLTGGVFSRSPKNLEYAAREFRVGNLYLNRGCTGAYVYRQPFGGAKMSGVGSKAGGPDYLLQFVIPRVVTENTMRRGFAPTGE